MYLIVLFSKRDSICLPPYSFIMNESYVILPKSAATPQLDPGQHLYFLGGPVRGGGDWQAIAIQQLFEKDPGCIVVCPCRYEPSHPLWLRQAIPFESKLVFENQTIWERYYLEHAAYFGSVIFWLPTEDSENPRADADGPYGQDTYGELGRWSIKSAHNICGFHKAGKGTPPITNVVVGAEKDYYGLKVIQRNFDADHGHPYHIHETLEVTLDRAVELAKSTDALRDYSLPFKTEFV